MGRVALQAGTWLGTVGSGIETQGVLGAEVPFAPRWTATGWLGVQRHVGGQIDPRDAVLGASWTAVSRDDLVVRLQPGLNLPTGGIGSKLYFTPLSTASVDPYLVADATWGGTWLVGGLAVARASLYPGWDRIRQGAFGRLDLRGARRLGPAVPWIGLSAVRQLPSGPVGAVPDFGELAATAGLVANLDERWSLTAQLRAPLWRSTEAERQFAGGLSVRTVLGRTRDDHDEDDGHDHGDGDGHDHGDDDHGHDDHDHEHPTTP